MQEINPQDWAHWNHFSFNSPQRFNAVSIVQVKLTQVALPPRWEFRDRAFGSPGIWRPFNEARFADAQQNAPMVTDCATMSHLCSIAFNWKPVEVLLMVKAVSAEINALVRRGQR